MDRSSAHHPNRTFFAVLVLLAVFVSVLGVTQRVQASQMYVLDTFATAAYNNQNGTANWASNWAETNDDGSATSGKVLITGGQLRLNNSTTPTLFPGIQRSVNIPTTLNAVATLSFNYSTANVAGTDSLVVEISTNGTSWTTLDTYTGAVSGIETDDITAYRSSNTIVRFRVTNGYTGANAYFYAGNVKITFWTANTQTSGSVLPYVQTFYLPVPEDQVLTALHAIAGAAVSPTFVETSITITTNNTVIYYDQGEDGYETTINNPTQNTTEVWGDNNPANGMPPGYTSDVLHAGDVINLFNPVNTSQLSLIKFDGGDKIASTEPIAITRTSWASGSSTLEAGSEEVLDTSTWGTTYDVPVSSTVQNYDFSYVGLAIMASQNNTQISKNGTLVATLNEGQSYLFSNTTALGDRITATAPVQATLMTGDIGSTYQSNFTNLFPNSGLSNSYYAMVPSYTTGTTSGTAEYNAIYLYNPNASSITVHWTTTAGNQTDITVPSHGAYRQLMPAGSGAHFYTGNSSVFSALSINDSGSPTYNWAYTLTPQNALTQQAKVGWGVGRDPLNNTNPSEDGSPVWFTVANTNGTAGNISVCIDYKGDNAGPNTYPNSNGNVHHYDIMVTAAQLSVNKVYDPSGDQTGMLLYVCNGSEADPNSKITVAWGQDATTASTGEPGLDTGSTVPPLPSFSAVKGAQLTSDINGNGQFDVGDTFKYQIRIDNTGALPVAASSITVADIVPPYTLYMPGSSNYYSSYTGVTAPISDNTVPPNTTTFPLDEGGYTIPEQLKVGQYFLVSFQVRINATLPGATLIQNQATISGLNLNYAPNVKIIVQPANQTSLIGGKIWLDLNGNGVLDSGEQGIPGVTVELRDGTCTPNLTCLTDVTDSSGSYSFPSLQNGTPYTVIVQTSTLPAGLTLTGDPDSVKDGQTTITLTSSNEPYTTANFGYQGNVSIGDFVWKDLNHNGLQDGGLETGLGNVKLNLTWAGLDGNLSTTADNLTFSTLTALDGSYNFSGLPAGTYQVSLDTTTLPANYFLTTTNPLTLSSLAAGTHYTTADFGAAPGATIGDYVWNDMNGDTIQNASESGISGVRVYIDSNGNGAYDAGEPNAVTDSNGYYLLSGLAAGTYSVRVDTTTVPAGYTLTTANLPLSVTLTAGQAYTTADFGYKVAALSISKVSSAGGQVKAGQIITYTLNILNNSGASQTGITVNDALPTGTTYVPNSTLANGFMWYFDNFNTLSYSNQSAGSATWGSPWTEVNEADGYNAGDVRVVTNAANCPDGANCIRITGASNPLRSLYRQADLSGCSAASLSYAYNNTITSATGNVSVAIYTGGNLSRTLATYNSGNRAKSTASFNLLPAELANNTRVYLSVGATGTGTTNRIYFDTVQFTCTIAKDNITGGAKTDLVNGTPASLVVSGDNFSLASGQSMTVSYQATVANPPYTPSNLASIDNTASVTSTQQTSAQQATSSDTILASIGDYVWNDANTNGIQDSGESGLAGVTVNLRDATGNVILQTTTTNASGAYSFSATPGTYVLEFVTPNGYAHSPQNQGSDTSKDSDSSVATGRTSAITVTAGQTENTIDAGFYPVADLSISKTDGVTSLNAGSTTTYTIRATNGGPSSVTGAILSDPAAAGLAKTAVTCSSTPGQCVNAPSIAQLEGGTFALPALASGQYYEIKVTAAVTATSGNVTNTATIAAPLGTTDTNSANNSASDTDTVNPIADLAVTKTDGVTSVNASTGGTLTIYTLTLTNNGPSAANNTTISDPPGSGMSKTAIGACNAAGGAVCPTVGSGAGQMNIANLEAGSVTVPALPSGGSISFSVTANITATSGTATNTFTATPPAGTTDPNSANNSASDTDTVNPVSDLSISKTDGVTSLNAGAATTYTIRATNLGPSSVTGAILSDPSVLSLTKTAVACSSTPGQCLTAPSIAQLEGGTFALPALASGQYYEITVMATVTGATGSISNTASIAAPGGITDPNTGNNSATDSDTVNGAIGNLVWNDLNGNGLQDSGEPGLSGVQVYVDSNTNGKYDTGEPTATTDANGNYSIPGLAAGTYSVRVDPSTLPAGYADTYDLDGKASPNVTNVTLSAGQVRSDVNFGYQQQNAVIGDFVWNDLNGNGIQDSGEPGISGVTVKLLDATGVNVLQTTTTSSSGAYSFTHLAAGSYIVQFVAPGPFLHSPQGQGGDATKDSNADPTTGKTGTITMTAGLTDNTVDAGFYQAEWGGLANTYGTPVTILYPLVAGVPQTVGSSPALWLGNTVQPATGPANLPNTPDPAADGVTLVNSHNWFEGSNGGTIQVQISSSSSGSNSAYLVVWFDWNHNGIFESSEAAVNQALSWSGTASTQSFTFNIPSGGLTQDLNYRARLFAAAPATPAAAFSGVYSNGEIEDYTASVNTLPVTMNYFYARTSGSELAVDWSTGTETGNLGFNLYLKTAQGLKKINTDLIPSSGFTTHDPQDYHFKSTAVQVSGNAKFYLEDVDILGRTKLHGPFDLNQVNGERITNTLTDWQKIRAQDDGLLAGISASNSRKVNAALQSRAKSVIIPGNNPKPQVQSTQKPTSPPAPHIATSTPTTKPPAKTKRSPTPKTPTKTATPAPTNGQTVLPTATLNPTDTPVPTDTAVAPSPTDIIPSATLEPSQTDTSAPSATDTPVPPATDTPAPPPPADTLAPTAPADTLQPVATDTTEPNATDTPMPTDTATLAPSPTATLPTAAPTAPTSSAVHIGDLLVNQTGIYRVSFEDLLAAGLDLSGQPAGDIALISKGAPVPISVSSPQVFGPGSTIEFFGQALNSLYTNNNVYSLWVDHANAVRVNEDQTAPEPAAQPAPFYLETALVDQNNAYDPLSTTGDPWYNTRMVVYKTAKSWNYSISVDHYLAGSAPAVLKLDVYGGTDYPGSPDHHVIVSFNSAQAASRFFDATNTETIQATIPEGTLKEGSNTLAIQLPGDTGQPADVVYLNQYSVNYPRSFWALNGYLNFSGSGQVFQVDNLADAAVDVYRLQAGTLTKLDGVVVTAQGSSYSARFNGSDQPASYYVTGASALLKPGIQAARPVANIKSGPAQYLIISHPDFISGLSPLVQARSAQGLSVKVVDVFDIYDQYSYGIIDPQAIKQYIAYAADKLGTQYVLLVGDDTYDYKNYAKTGSISFIPSIYMPAGDLVQYAPVDPEYVDLNNDNLPDLAIGRFAVRTPTELSNVISKTLAYGAKNYGKTSIFTADAGYSLASDDLLSRMPADWSNTQAYLDTVGVTQAHTTLLASINAGTALTDFIGHTDDWEWTWNGLFSIFDAPNLTNTGRPTILNQNGCWNNYYVNPEYETMQDTMLNDGSNGAAAMIGSTTLTSDLNEQKLGDYFIPLLTRPGNTIGQAMLAAKQSLAANDPKAVDVLLGWTLLGDPTLEVTP